MILGTLVVWVIVGIVLVLRDAKFPSDMRLALTVTISLVAAYATAVYLNHLSLIPRFWQRGVGRPTGVSLLLR